jgi:broad-specificity NMP kinase
MIIAIFGTNASGKTSVAKHLIGDDLIIWGVRQGDLRYNATHSGDNNTIAFGSYDIKKKMGGADVESKDLIKKLEHFIEFTSRDQDKRVLIEGSVIAYPKNIRRFNAGHKRVKSIILTASYEEILKRLALRNDEVKVYKSVQAKIRNCENLARTCKREGWDFIIIDTTNKTMDQVLKIVDDYVNTK